MNVHDSEQIVALLTSSGYEYTKEVEDADLIIVNTCSIREKAAQKVCSQLGRFRDLKERKHSLIICVCGCLAQQWGSRFFRRVPHLDMVLGTHQIHRISEFITNIEKTGDRVVETDFESSVQSNGILSLPNTGAVQAFVTVMQGCNNFCSYCVVPYVRGREESRKSKDILDEVKALAEHGIKEVTLLGQNVNSYGRTNGDGVDFAGLLREMAKIDGICRIRFTTSHPKDLSDALIECIAEVEPVCEHIHLPVQSGSNHILKRMKRDYTRDDYIQRVANLRSICSQISITSDIIVGFPGETEADYQATLDLMEEVRFDNIFSFQYSEREGTAALKLDGKIDERLKRERLVKLQRLQEDHTWEKNLALEGRHVDVLVERVSKNGTHDVMGRTRSNKIVNFPGSLEWIGREVSVLIRKAYLHSLRGEVH